MKVSSKKTQLYVGGFVLLMLAIFVFVQTAFNLKGFLNPSTPSQILFLYAVDTLVFLVLLVFAFILGRILIKVGVERVQQKPGSKFRTRLVAFLILLAFTQAVLLFLFAYGLVTRSIDKWFSLPADEIFDAAKNMSDESQAQRTAMTRSIMDHLSAEMPRDLDSARVTFGMKALMLIDSQGRITQSSADAGTDLQGLKEAIVFSVGNKGEISFDIEGYSIGARHVQTVQGTQILAAVFPIPRNLIDLTAKIAADRSLYAALKQNKTSYRDTYVTLLALMTVLALFAAVWVALLMSKRITVPIDALSEATREISQGNLSFRVHIKADDELGMLVTLFNDMAERLEGTTIELESRRRYMEVILENIPTAVVSIDPDFHVNKVNRAARTMFSTEGAISLEQIFTGGDLHAILNVLSEAEHGSVTREIAFSSPGRPAHSAVTASALTGGGFVLVVEDLTEIMRAQKASTWREVARRLAHEIRNPLTPIQLSAERIARNISRLPAASPRVTTVIQECVEAIVEEVSSLKHLVDEFVRFARLPTVARVPNNMRELVDRTMSLYEDRLNGTRVTIDVPDDLPQVLMDSLLMKRVLINVIDNALEALSGEPRQELILTCELARDKTMARLTIADTGSGIAAEDRERLFTPYFSTRKHGTGLGLAISSRIVADHGGYIGVEPNLPKGTRFVIELPICHES